MLEKTVFTGANFTAGPYKLYTYARGGWRWEEDSKALANFRCQSHDTELAYVKGERSGRMEEINYNGFSRKKKISVSAMAFLHCSCVILNHEFITIN